MRSMNPMRPMAQVNVIPFIDVMLVLLAVVLTTATFVAQGKIPIDLPSGGQAQNQTRLTPIEITIDAQGAIYLEQRKLQSAALDKALSDNLDKLVPVHLHVDAQAAFEHFVRVIDVLKARQLENISIITRRSQD